MRQKWIDFLKTLAMIAVLQNHLPQEARLYNVLYSIYSVSLFVLCGGVTAAISLENQTKFEYKTYLWKKVKTIMLPYFVATCGYVIFEIGYFDVFYMFNRLVNFTYGSNGHMYYLVFYFELILIAPLLVKLYENSEMIQIGILASSAMVAYIFEKYTYLDRFILGSRYLFGGSYFLLYNLGIYIYFHTDLLDKLIMKILMFFAGIFAFGIIVYREWYLVWWSNPPSVKVIVYTIVVFLLGYSSITLLQQLAKMYMRVGGGIFSLKLICVPGRYSLYIYLWHMMLIDILSENGTLTRIDMELWEKLLISCCILYLPYLFYMLYKKGVTLFWRFIS